MISLSASRQARRERLEPVQQPRKPVIRRIPNHNMTKLLEHLAIVAYDFGVSVVALQGPGRSKPLPSIRQEFCRRAVHLGYSTTKIGKALNRDHTSILYLLNRLSTKPLGGELNRQGFDLG